MKKTLLLSVVASTMIMAGGDIAPVEPVVETPMVAEASGWDFAGNSVAYYQTNDAHGNGDLGSGSTTSNDFGIQLRATNNDIFAGIGAGVELTGLYSGSDDTISNLRIQDGGNGRKIGGAVTQAYLTYGIANTSIKVGRQHLPQALSPFAFTENWQPITNSFDAALVVNSDLPDTTLVYAAVQKANSSTGDIGAFDKINPDGDVVHLITAQNKSIDGLTLTGSYYYAPDMVSNGNDANILWGDAEFAISDYTIGLQGGQISLDTLSDTTAFGAKVGANLGMFDASLAYSSVDDGEAPIQNLGGEFTPLYTQMLLNSAHIASDNDTIVARAGVEALGGRFDVAYDYTTDNSALNNDYQELDLTYSTKVFSESTTLFAGYIYQDADAHADSQNTIRAWARYNFN